MRALLEAPVEGRASLRGAGEAGGGRGPVMAAVAAGALGRGLRGAVRGWHLQSSGAPGGLLRRRGGGGRAPAVPVAAASSRPRTGQEERYCMELLR